MRGMIGGTVRGTCAVLATGFLMAAGTWPAAAQEPAGGARPTVLDLAPEDAWFVARLDAAAYRAGLPGTPIGRLLGNADLCTSLRGVLDGLVRIGLRQAGDDLPPGLSPQDLFLPVEALLRDAGDIFTGEVGVVAGLPQVHRALGDGEFQGVSVPAAVVIDTAERRTIETAVSSLFLAGAVAGAESVRDAQRVGLDPDRLPVILPLETVHETVDGVRVHQIRAARAPWFHAEYFVIGDRLVLSTGGDLYRTMIARHQAAAAGRAQAVPGLASSETFRAVDGRIGAASGHFLLYADAGRLRDRLLGLMEDPACPCPAGVRDRVRAGIVASGLDGIGALGISSSFEGGGFRDRTYLSCPGGARGLLAAIRAPEGGAGDPAGAVYWAPNATDVASFPCDLAALWDAGWAFLEACGPEQAGPLREQVRARLGFDLREEILGRLGREWSVSSAALPGPMPIPSVLVATRCGDPAAALDALAARLTASGLTVTEVGQGGPRRIAVGIPGMAVPMVIPTLGADGEFLLVGTSPATIQQAVERRAGGRNLFLEREDVRASLSHLSAGPRESLSCSDVGGKLRQGYQQLMMMVPLAAMALGPDAGVIDFSRFPGADDLFGTFFPSVTAGRWDGEGFLSETYGPVGAATSVGLVGGAVGVGVVAGVGVATTRGVSRRAEEIRARREMEDLRRGIDDLEAVLTPPVQLGIEYDPAFEEVGVRVTRVSPGSPAEAAGLREGDVIVRLAGVAVLDGERLKQALAAHAPGEQVSVGVRRGEETLAILVTLASSSDTAPAEPEDGTPDWFDE